MALTGRTHPHEDERAAETVQAALVGAAGLVLLPALVLGIAAAEFMRWRELRWTWTLAPLAATAIPLWSSRHDAAAAVCETAYRGLSGHFDVFEIARAGAPWWLVASCLVAVCWKLRRDRDDRYHGGERAERLDRARGPAALGADRHRPPPCRQLALQPESGVLVGRDLHSGRPVHVPPPRSMLTLIGASNTGKTTLATAFVEGMVDFGASLTALDPKAGRATAHRCRDLAHRHGRRFLLVSLEPFGDKSLDRHRVYWNCIGSGNPTEIKDTILAGEDFSEPYYLATGERGVLAAAGCLVAEGRRPNAATLAALLEDPHELAARLERVDRDGFGAEAAWLADLTKSELSALRGIASRLARLIQSEGGRTDAPTGRGRARARSRGGDAHRRDCAVLAGRGRLPGARLPARALPHSASQHGLRAGHPGGETGACGLLDRRRLRSCRGTASGALRACARGRAGRNDARRSSSRSVGGLDIERIRIQRTGVG